MLTNLVRPPSVGLGLVNPMQPCLFCESLDQQAVLRGHDRLHPVGGNYDVSRCKRCGLVFLNPQPGPEELAAHYPATYYSLGGDRSWDGRDERLYRAFHTGGLLDRLACLPYRPWMRTVVGEVGARVLDVGCGSGHFLAIAKKIFALEAYGVEPYAYDRDYADRNGLEIVHGTLHEAAFPDNFFDVVMLSNVLEHLPDPRAVLVEAMRVLKVKGSLMITVPNSNSPLFRIFRGRWFCLDVPRHLFIPSRANLKEFAASVGFEIVKTRYVGNSEGIVGSLFYCWNDVLGRQEYLGQRQWSRKALAVTLPFAALLNLMRMGDYMELQFAKPY